LREADGKCGGGSILAIHKSVDRCHVFIDFFLKLLYDESAQQFRAVPWTYMSKHAYYIIFLILMK
jgi:hypothetical protein